MGSAIPVEVDLWLGKAEGISSKRLSSVIFASIAASSPCLTSPDVGL